MQLPTTQSVATPALASVRHLVADAELVQPAGSSSDDPGDADAPRPSGLRSTVLLRSEDTGGAVSVMANTVPAGAGPPLHRHDFDEVFLVLQGTLLIRVGDTLRTRTAGQLAFAPRSIPHALANPGPAPAEYLLVCTPAGLERHFARLAAAAEGTEPPPWALQPVPEVVPLGPPLLAEPSSSR